jgi:ElaB/YqjD/DUF883 family membrane-anchored ribosome-binding protein
MEKPEQIEWDDLGTLVEDARAFLIAATAHVAEEEVHQARVRLAAALERGKDVYGRARENAGRSAQAGDEAVREHPYQLIGVGFVIGALIGFLVVRGRSPDGRVV